MDDCNFTETLEDRIKRIQEETKILTTAYRALIEVSELPRRSFPNYFVSTVGYLALESQHGKSELMSLYEARAERDLRQSKEEE